MESGVGLSVKLPVAGEPPHAVAGEREAVGVVHQPVQDGVGQGGVADDVVPLVDGDLAGDDRGAAALSVFEDLQEVDALGRGEHGQAPVVEDQQVDAAEGLEQAAVAAVATGERQRLEEARGTLVEDGAPVAASFVAKRAGDPALADAAGPGDQAVLMAVDRNWRQRPTYRS
jgi:hypothetical protein